ncbi:MAG: hypothetical protein HY791_05225 [Deltaproteobacteria bacterium]|nr:hypothetical protein [Deltaproteobacteria bacterium]
MSRLINLLLAVPLTVSAPAFAQEEGDQKPPSEPSEQAPSGENPPAEDKKEPEKKEEKAAPKMSDKELGMAVWSGVSMSASAIDNCTGRYIEEFKDAKGEVKIAFKVEGKSTPSDVNVTTSLESSDKLMKCLRDVARRWTFPPKTNFELSIDVKVSKGTKFVLLKPGEQPPPPPPGQPKSDEDPGFVSFEPRFVGEQEEKQE